MEMLHLIGRVIAGGFFLMNAFNHFTQADTMAGYAASRGVPAAKPAVYGSGMFLLLGGLSLLLGVYPTWGILLLVIFLLATAFMIHKYWALPEEQKMSEQVNFTKNLGLAGLLLALLALEQPWPYSLGG